MLTEKQKKYLQQLNNNEMVLNLTSEEDIEIILEYIRNLSKEDKDNLYKITKRIIK